MKMKVYSNFIHHKIVELSPVRPRRVHQHAFKPRKDLIVPLPLSIIVSLKDCLHLKQKILNNLVLNCCHSRNKYVHFF